MTEQEKNIIAKLGIIKEMATEKSVQQLCQVQIEYIKIISKDKIGFEGNDK